MTDIPAGQSAATAILPSYLYVQYSDDDDLQAFVAGYNSLAQGYLDWFNGAPLALYTSPNIVGGLLDWVGTNLYGVERPVIGQSTTYSTGAVNTFAVNALPVDGAQQFFSGTAAPVSDDIYKRVLTWLFYRGDGRQMSIDWLKRRVARFLGGVAGGDIGYPNGPLSPDIAIGGIDSVIGAVNTFAVNTLPVDASGLISVGGFLITLQSNAYSQALKALIENGVLTMPFEDTFMVVLEGAPTSVPLLDFSIATDSQYLPLL